MVTEQDLIRLCSEARLFKGRAFSFRSHHAIGAAVLTVSDDIFGGCNIESIISGLGSCAEQNAINHAVIHGQSCFRALATFDTQQNFPCGVCLQYLLQFAQIDDIDTEIVAFDETGSYSKSTLSALLPCGYRTKHNLAALKEYKGQRQ
jgi:cytidine deaminase